MSVIQQLARYYRFLGELQQQGTTRISSRELSELMGLTASQIRQDLNCFGDFGQAGLRIQRRPVLRHEISAILGIDHSLRTVVIGAGNLGRAVALYMAFETKGPDCIGIFDKKETITGKIVCGMPVRHIDGWMSSAEKIYPRSPCFACRWMRLGKLFPSSFHWGYVPS